MKKSIWNFLKKGDAIIVRITERISRYPALKPYKGKLEWFTVKSNGPVRGLMATWDIYPLIEIKILDDEVAQAPEK